MEEKERRRNGRPAKRGWFFVETWETLGVSVPSFVIYFSRGFGAPEAAKKSSKVEVDAVQIFPCDSGIGLGAVSGFGIPR